MSNVSRHTHTLTKFAFDTKPMKPYSFFATFATVSALLLCAIVNAQALDTPGSSTSAASLANVFPDRTDLLDPERVQSGARVEPPTAVSAKNYPEPPRSLKDGRYRAVVAMIVEIDGTVRMASAIVSSGSKTLDDACVESVRRYKFVPAKLDGEPRAQAVVQEFKFIIQ